ncbi:phage portal protein [Streptomyces boncukensis]|uniref:Phage portal protein n=1 Tax=Streptomyces boncukensis TaxID=2711219 RepID=A0A6G4WPG9_9ACTN|nr:phage portal protein [Streptomyces boncukensis]NGO67159.1 phage portal protein [Streptomyces boncukensis]
MRLPFADTVARLERKLSGGTNTRARLDRYYEGRVRLASIGLSLPPEMRQMSTVVNWPALYVDALEERLDVEGFRLDGAADADERLWEWWQANDLDEESQLAHLDALVYGRAFVTVGTAPEEGAPPVIRVESARTMAADFDPYTRRVTAALRVLAEDPEDEPHDRADAHPTAPPYAARLYLPDRTVSLERVPRGGVWQVTGEDVHQLGRPLVEMLTNRGRAGERSGASEMRDVIGLTDAACRTLTNMQGAQELLAVPQRYVLGARQEDFQDAHGQPIPAWEAYIGRFLMLASEDAKAGQFPAADLRNFTEVMNLYAQLVASVTGLPPHYLGQSTDNPASADAIRSSEARLIKRAERKQRAFGGAWERVMRLAMLVEGMDPARGTAMETDWRDAATPTVAARADAVTKLVAAGILPVEAAWEQLGYSPQYRARLRSLTDTDPAVRYLAATDSSSGNTGPDDDSEDSDEDGDEDEEPAA